jgi:hypothetical protein
MNDTDELNINVIKRLSVAETETSSDWSVILYVYVGAVATTHAVRRSCVAYTRSPGYVKLDSNSTNKACSSAQLRCIHTLLGLRKTRLKFNRT